MTDGSSQGLFVIVAVVIFGIFVLISYVLFRDNLKVGLASIFEDSIEQALEDLSGDYVISSREDSKYLYAKIREANESLNETEIWVKALKLKDGTLQIDGSSTSDSNYAYGTNTMTGSLIMPDKINNMKITSIQINSLSGAFAQAKFTGKLKLPSYLTNLGDVSFKSSIFTGTLNLPKTLTNIGNESLKYSKFSGDLVLPNGLTKIGIDALTTSEFTGNLKLPNSLTTLEARAFTKSVFTGELKLPENLTMVHAGSLAYSKFTGTLKLPKSLKKIGHQAFLMSEFTGTLDVSNVTVLQGASFDSSKIDSVIRGSVEMSTDTTTNNVTGINKKGIKLSDGNYYTG